MESILEKSILIEMMQIKAIKKIALICCEIVLFYMFILIIKDKIVVSAILSFIFS